MQRKRLIAQAACVFLVAAFATFGAAAAPPMCKSYTLPNKPPYPNGGAYDGCSVDTGAEPTALCNDGSIPVFQVQRAANTNSTKWVIWLEGGTQCIDQPSCLARWMKMRSLTTSHDVKPQLGAGVLSHNTTVDPVLGDANTVLVHYCSSDFWSGGYLAPNGPSGFKPNTPATWNFEGRAVARAAVRSLGEIGFNFGGATQIVLGGGSAGGVGISVTANDLLPLLPARAQVLFANDAGFTLDIGQYVPNSPAPHAFTGPDDQRAVNVMLNTGRVLWHGRGDAGCDGHAHTPAEHTACYNTSALLQQGYIKLPAFVNESQLDTAQLTDQLCPQIYGKCNVPHDPQSTMGVYATYFGMQMAQLVSENGAPSLPYTAYSPDLYAHVLLEDDTAFITKLPFSPTNLAPRDVFDAWYANPTAPGTAYLGTGPGVQ